MTMIKISTKRSAGGWILFLYNHIGLFSWPFILILSVALTILQVFLNFYLATMLGLQPQTIIGFVNCWITLVNLCYLLYTARKMFREFLLDIPEYQIPAPKNWIIIVICQPLNILITMGLINSYSAPDSGIQVLEIILNLTFAAMDHLPYLLVGIGVAYISDLIKNSGWY